MPFVLESFQEDAIREALLHKHGTVLLPTGSGKSAVAVGIIIALKQPTVVLVPTKVLIDQWVRTLSEAGIEAGVWYGDEKREGFVTLTTYQSLYSNPELVREFPVLLMDEGDLTTGDVWRHILDEAKAHEYAVILTATLPTDPDRRADLEKRFPILIRRSPREMIAAGRFVPVRVESIPVHLGPAEQKQYDDVEERLRNLRRILGTGMPQRIVAITRTGTPDMRRAAFGYLKLMAVRQEILSRVPQRAEELLRIAQNHPAERVLVFGTRVDTLADAAAYLTMNGIPARVLSGETLPDERRYIIEEWGLGFFVLGSVQVLERGYNVPAVSVAVILGGGTGERRLIQRVGRIVRPAPDKETATVYVVYAIDTTEDRLPVAVRRLFAGDMSAPEGDDDATEQP